MKAATIAEQATKFAVKEMATFFLGNPVCQECPEEPSVGSPMRIVAIADGTWIASHFSGCSTIRHGLAIFCNDGEKSLHHREHEGFELAGALLALRAVAEELDCFYYEQDEATADWAAVDHLAFPKNGT